MRIGGGEGCATYDFSAGSFGGLLAAGVLVVGKISGALRTLRRGGEDVRRDRGRCSGGRCRSSNTT